MSQARGGELFRGELLSNLRRVVIKVGSSVIASSQVGGLDPRAVASLAAQIGAVWRSGKEVVLVSSGAISAGLEALGLNGAPKSMPLKQAAAAVGQSRLIQTYDRHFRRMGLTVAQVLLTHEDVHDRKRFLNARNTFFTLLSRGVLPIVNENDTVAVEEIQFGDNDTLSALVTLMVEADLLLILTDVEGLYTADPHLDEKARLLSEAEPSEEAIHAAAGPGLGPIGTGGMVTKLQAARTVGAGGIPSVVAFGRRPGVIPAVLAGEEIGTLFRPRGDRLKGRKPWIAFGRKTKGRIVVDAGARRALTEGGKSLLPSGVLDVEGSFGFGDSASCVEENGREFARGLVNYSSEELKRIKGQHTRAIEAILGSKLYDEVIHRDNLVLL
jgi:glutamate 5-kinase